MAKVSVDDLKTMYLNTVCLYRNKPYYINQISPRYIATCTDLFSQRQVDIEMDENTFDNPTLRIGFINIMGSVLYVQRRPVRRYKAGLHKENTTVNYLPFVNYPQGAGPTLAAAQGLQHISIADAMYGRYPTFLEALEKLKVGNTVAVAIDHQFVITKERNVVYKLEIVGEFPAKAKSVYDIVFSKEFTHLITLLDNNHEKSI